ncbi:hypothetical protein QUF50_02795 [Thiotrichales bacterium HSG1]|nr:hypothetical protein [Thiotrichales bacterium HSG1]
MKPKFTYQVNHAPQDTEFDTHNLFDKDYVESDSSAIDTFLEKTQGLRNLLSKNLILENSDEPKIPKYFANLMILAYISAVESYFRKIIRSIILIDKIAQKASENQNLTYGAAIIHSPDMLPEALLENCSFASKKNIIDTIRIFIGIKGNMPDEVNGILEHFSKVCQLRHCIIHRFGHLGSKNMIELGLDEHSDYLEKPLKLDFNKLNEIFLVCNSTVKVINNFLFQTIMARTVIEKSLTWHWDFNKDKQEFEKYYKRFFSKIEPPNDNATIKYAYKQFKEYFERYTHS